MKEEIINELEENMQKSLDNLNERFKTVRTGRANPSSLDKVMVSYYGVMTPLRSLSNVTVPEARQLLIKPFDKGALSSIEKAIYEANLGYTPNNDGENIRIVIPPLTEDRRKELVKTVKAMAEDTKVAIRNARHDAMELLKSSELPEDEEKNVETEIQNMVNKYNKKVEEELSVKENDLMVV